MFNTDKKLRIPKQFTLLGHKYSVVMVPDLFEKEDCYGTADDDTKEIRLQTPGMVKKRYEENGKNYEVDVNITHELVVETFFHEVTHAILESIGETELSNNERFVNMMGKSFLEIYLSCVYEEDHS